MFCLRSLNPQTQIYSLLYFYTVTRQESQCFYGFFQGPLFERLGDRTGPRGSGCSIRRTVPTRTGFYMRRMLPIMNSTLALYDERLRSHRLQNGSPTCSARGPGVRTAFYFVGGK